MAELQTQISFSPSFVPTAEHLEIREAIQILPLDNVRQKLAEQGSLPEGVVDSAVLEYRKFLILAGMGFRHKLAMCSDAVDEVWHTHILFTMEYVSACNRIFGKYLHHKPQLGENWGDKERVVGFCELYQRVFGELPVVWKASADCNTIACQTCVGEVSCVPGGN